MPVDEDPLPPEEIPINSPVRIYQANLCAAISVEPLVRSYTTNAMVARSSGEDFRNYSSFIMVAISIEPVIEVQTTQRRKHNRSLVCW